MRFVGDTYGFHPLGKGHNDETQEDARRQPAVGRDSDVGKIERVPVEETATVSARNVRKVKALEQD